MAFRQEHLHRIKKLICNTPFNRNYIAESSLKKLLKETIPYATGRVLDVGCGEKPYEHLFRPMVGSYTGIDLPAAHSFYSPSRRHADIYGTASNLPFKTESFGTLICAEVLPHVESPQAAFSEYARVLKSGGILVVTANKTWERRTGLPVPDYWRFTDEGLAQLARQQSLEVVYTKPGCGFFGTIGQLFSRFLNKELIYRKAVVEGVDRDPKILLAVIVLPFCAIIQSVFLLLDKIYYSKLDTLSYILVARKPAKAFASE